MRNYIQGFDFFLPTRLIYGVDAVSTQLAGQVEDLAARAVTVVSGKHVTKAGILKKVTDVLEGIGIRYNVFNDVEANPSTDTCYKGTETAKAVNAEAIIAVGGGSPMDVAKSIAILMTNGGILDDYEGVEKYANDPLPFLAVPTTAGTGTEVTPYAVITIRKRNYKMTIIGKKMLPNAAVLDPTLVTSVPASVAAACGMDVLTHAIEAYTNLVASPFTDACALEAIRLVGKYLRTYVADRRYMEGASGMLVANTLAGIAFGVARLGDVHAMAHPVSGYFDVAHGVANAILLPHVMKFNMLADRGQYRRIADLLGEDVAGLSDREAAPLAIEAVMRLSTDLGIPKGLSEVGVTEDKIPNMAADAMLSGNVVINPRMTALEDLVSLLHAAM